MAVGVQNVRQQNWKERTRPFTIGIMIFWFVMAISMLAQLAPSALQFLCPSGSWSFLTMLRCSIGPMIASPSSCGILGAAADRNPCGPFCTCWRKDEGPRGVKRFCATAGMWARTIAGSPSQFHALCAKAIAEGGKACACVTLNHPRAIEDDETGGSGRRSTCKLSMVELQSVAEEREKD